ncbi:hypothetical protein ACFWQC_07400 [Nocardioides sp. NPDC058538]
MIDAGGTTALAVAEALPRDITDAAPADDVIKQLSALDVEILHAGGAF